MDAVRRIPLGQISRSVLIVSAAAFIAAGVWLASSLWTSLPALALSVFAATFTIARRWPAVAPAVMLLPACLLPALVRHVAGGFDPAHVLVWLASLLGGIVGLRGFRDWVLPRLWCLLLVHGALCVAMSAVVVACRELDWTTQLLHSERVWVTAQGIHPRVALVWIAYVATAQLVALLWLDALFDRYRKNTVHLNREVVLPLVTSIGLGAAVAVVQMFWDIEWLNSRMFAFLRRASGLLLDANSMGMTAALGTAAAIALGLGATRRRALILAVVAVVSVTAVWGSGSRTASLVALVILGSTVLVVCARALHAGGRVKLLVGIGMLTVALATGVSLVGRAETVGPIARVHAWIANASGERTVRSTLRELWDRDGYGLAAASMIGRYPWTGVGPGVFHLMVLDYTSPLHDQTRLPTDNAQNWLRHQVAETGVLGSIGWASWAVLFMAWIVHSRVWRRPVGTVLSAALVGVAAVSLVSVPTQNPAVLMIAATLVFWLRTVSGDEGPDTGASAGAWIVVWAGALVFAVATFLVARTDLRLPERAIRAGWTYNVGYYDVETAAGRSFRWTKPRAIIAFTAPRGYLRLAYSVQHQHLSVDPVRVRFWRDGELVIDEILQDNQLRTAYLFVGRKRNGIILESEVNRPFMDHGRQLGIAIQDWEVVTRPPPGARIIN